MRAERRFLLKRRARRDNPSNLCEPVLFAEIGKLRTPSLPAFGRDRRRNTVGHGAEGNDAEAESQVPGKSCTTNRRREINRPFRTRITTEVTFQPAPLLARNS